MSVVFQPLSGSNVIDYFHGFHNKASNFIYITWTKDDVCHFFFSNPSFQKEWETAKQPNAVYIKRINFFKMVFDTVYGQLHLPFTEEGLLQVCSDFDQFLTAVPLLLDGESFRTLFPNNEYARRYEEAKPFMVHLVDPTTRKLIATWFPLQMILDGIVYDCVMGCDIVKESA